MLYTLNDCGDIKLMIKFTDEQKKTLIQVEHIKHGKSLRLIERESGMSNDTLRKFAKKNGIVCRSRIESIRANQQHIIYPSGDAHWRSTNQEASKRLSEIHSKGMKAQNPSHDKDVRLKITASLAATLKNSPTFHESLMIDFFNEHKIPFEHQFNTGNYIADFRVCNILIELDGRGHASRKASDIIRDKAITDLGFYVVRVDQDSLFNKRYKNSTLKPFKLMSIIKNLIKWDCRIINFWHFSSCLIPDTGKYRVIIRKPDGLPEVIC
jgi:very-short-patch-repair endonuclease